MDMKNPKITNPGFNKELRKFYRNIMLEKAEQYNSLQDFIKDEVSLYHGTYTKFSDFSIEKAWSHTERDNSKFGIYFLKEKEHVETFLDITKYYTPGNKNKEIKEVWAVMNKTLDLTLQGIFNNKEQAPLLIKLTWWEDFKEKSQDECLEMINEEIDLWEIADFYDAIYNNEWNRDAIISEGYDTIVSKFWKEEKWEILEYCILNTEQIFTKWDLKGIYLESKK